jgi:trk system potassium uptake protein TrkH
MNWKIILYLLGIVLMIVAAFMLLPLCVSMIYGDGDLFSFLKALFLTFTTGIVLVMANRKHKKEDLRHRDGFISVTLSWVVIAFFGSLPYLFEGTFGGITDAYFEAMAGFTTTGSSVMTDIEAQPHGILFWRSLSQWLGGMGIVLFSLAILPMLGVGGMQLFRAEVPEITVDRLRPRIVDTAKALWYIYALLTAVAAGMYMIGGMGLFDSVCHAFTTLATGGFSTKNASMAHYDSTYIHFVATLFMFLAGVNYTLYFFAFRGNLNRLRQSTEFRFYLFVVISATMLLLFDVWHSKYTTFLESFQYSMFQVVSIMTTTGYVTADYEKWSPFAQSLIISLMFFGGMIGSTGGGMKQIRVLVMIKQIYREIYQLIHPHAVTFLKVDGKNLTKEILGSIWGFLFLFIVISVVSAVIISSTGVDIVTSLSTSVSAICNVGPALGTAGPVDNYASLPQIAKWVLIFCMLTGRLEIYTVIIIFIPNFWKK